MSILDELRKAAVWEKGRITTFDPAQWRMDCFGSYIRCSEYGLRTPFGWDIDHIDPNGSDDLSNLQPLYWLNNRRKSDVPLPSFLSRYLLGLPRTR